MTPQSATQRKAAERKRKAAAGLKRVEVWCKPEHHARITAYAAKLREGKL